MSRDRTLQEVIEDHTRNERRALEEKELSLRLVADAARKEALPKVYVVLCPSMETQLWSVHRTKRGAEETLTGALRRDQLAYVDGWDLHA